MERESHQASAAAADGLTARQREDAVRVLGAAASLAAVLVLLEARIDETRRCPHCAVEGAVVRGRSTGLRRYGCKGCGKTFNALTGTSLVRLRKKALWAAVAARLGEGDTVKGAAARCGVADTTSFRWRHRLRGRRGAWPGLTPVGQPSRMASANWAFRFQWDMRGEFSLEL